MGVHRFAVATAVATFCLLVAGGLVSTTESGLACPDWPLCEGQYFPKLINGKQFEHTHRLVAASVALMTFGLSALLLRRRRKERLLIRLGLLACAVVVVQALLGALTVKLALPAWVSSLHQATAMGFFCLMVSLAFLTRPRTSGSHSAIRRHPGLSRLNVAVIGLTYAQIVAGAVMRHTRGGLACGYEFPLCLGQLWPAHGHLGIQAHLVHRWGGVLVGLAVAVLAIAVWRTVPDLRLKMLAAASVVGVVAQMALGVATVFSSRDLIIMTVHSSVGAGLLALLIAIYWLGLSSFVSAPLASIQQPSVEPELEPA